MLDFLPEESAMVEGLALGSEVFPEGGDRAKAVFWVGANIIFDPQTGAANQVLLFVYREEDASVFTFEDATSFLAFIKPRAERISAAVRFEIVESKTVLQRWVIKGEQDVV
jgi:hypothetical protein